jgi:hypothetical protein
MICASILHSHFSTNSTITLPSPLLTSLCNFRDSGTSLSPRILRYAIKFPRFHVMFPPFERTAMYFIDYSCVWRSRLTDISLARFFNMPRHFDESIRLRWEISIFRQLLFATTATQLILLSFWEFHIIPITANRSPITIFATFRLAYNTQPLSPVICRLLDFPWFNLSWKWVAHTPFRQFY